MKKLIWFLFGLSISCAAQEPSEVIRVDAVNVACAGLDVPADAEENTATVVNLDLQFFGCQVHPDNGSWFCSYACGLNGVVYATPVPTPEPCPVCPTPTPTPLPTPTPTPLPAFEFLYSVSADRSFPNPLDGTIVSGNIYAFVPDVGGITNVVFRVDTTLIRTENTSPYDMFGGSVSVADPYDTNGLTDGTHTFTAEVNAGGTVTELIANVVVDNIPDITPTPGPTPTPAPTSTPQPSAGEPCTEITASPGDNTYTWTTSNTLCGQFENGDWWISPETGNSVTIESVSFTGGESLRVDANPNYEQQGLVPGYGNYDTGQVLSFPQSFTADVSLVAAIKKTETGGDPCGTDSIEGNCADSYHVVTALMTPPPEHALRPPISWSVKPTLTTVGMSQLPYFSYFSAPSNLENIRERWSHSLESMSVMPFNSANQFCEGGRCMRADALTDDYAAGNARNLHNDIVGLLAINGSSPDKEKAFAAILTYGWDIYASIYAQDGTRLRNWGSGAGQHLGKHLPALLFATFVGSSLEKNVIGAVTALEGFSDKRAPHEIEQVNVCANGNVLWGDSPDGASENDHGSLWKNMRLSNCTDNASGSCNSNTGPKNQRDPYCYIDGPHVPGTNYMTVSYGPIRDMTSILALVPEMRTVCNCERLFTYVSRVHTHGLKTLPDPCAPPNMSEPSSCDEYRSEGCEEYSLSNTGTATYGPVPGNFSQCVSGSGRFPSRDGNTVGLGGFASSQITDNFTTIFAEF